MAKDILLFSEPCPVCGGTGRLNRSKACPACGGSGVKGGEELCPYCHADLSKGEPHSGRCPFNDHHPEHGFLFEK